ncbi:hypothetical protein Nepgr_033874 [Nepenthes gracilis]|uniref:Uncharacterized protein n=1 Tax=Nepenthes gracilis TaxID=150966 RepID=A0AAD3TL70_NEPGR|nr:hypothetical protein Nepgr_033874 [Nepenthes gracilis]
MEPPYFAYATAEPIMLLYANMLLSKMQQVMRYVVCCDVAVALLIWPGGTGAATGRSPGCLARLPLFLLLISCSLRLRRSVLVCRLSSRLVKAAELAEALVEVGVPVMAVALQSAPYFGAFVNYAIHDGAVAVLPADSCCVRELSLMNVSVLLMQQFCCYGRPLGRFLAGSLAAVVMVLLLCLLSLVPGSFTGFRLPADVDWPFSD